MDRRRLSSHGETILIVIRGRVQGVGFRPFLFHLAKEYGIKGTVQNNRDGVRVIAENEAASNLEQFVQAIPLRAPELAKIVELTVTSLPFTRYSKFEIIETQQSGASASIDLPPDYAVCEECLKEMADPQNRRYRYPFINCTQCGPRYSIIRDLPYDRALTTMSTFAMCECCQHDYDNVHDRRFHAQPTACEKCGPTLKLTDMSGQELASQEAAVVLTKQLLKDGAIVAVKGIGGYHLACDARNSETVSRLRQRKRRPKRPFAVMARSLDSCEEVGILSSEEKMLLTAPERPIVVVRQRGASDLASGVAPDTRTVGVASDITLDVRTNFLAADIAPDMCTIGLMLPYTPLHHLLLEDEELDFVVMTSANPSGHPILYRDDEVLTYLASVADYILTHDREIVHPIEDSVVQWKDGELDFLRRGRGYVPDPYETLHDVEGIVALGSQQKNTVTFGRGKQMFVGPPNGDLTNLDIERHGQEEYGQFVKLLGVSPHTAAIDMHPGYTTRELVSDAEDIQFVSIQHHHAHHVSCMEDNGLTENCYGLILDGTGYGTDRSIWGFELLYGNAVEVDRLGHLKYTPLPGGEICVKQPWRSAVAMVLSLLPQNGDAWLRRLYPGKDHEIDLIRTMIEKQINAPLAGTCGRLFDAVSSLLGLCHVSTYDGEAAIVLSELASFYKGDEVLVYPYSINKVGSLFEINCSRMLEEIIQSITQGVAASEIALRFHETVADAAVNLLLHAHEEQLGSSKGIVPLNSSKEVVLSGGSFHNRYLSAKIKAKLEREGFAVFVHKRVPCSDSGISQGQLIIAAQQKNRDQNLGSEDQCV